MKDCGIIFLRAWRVAVHRYLCFSYVTLFLIATPGTVDAQSSAKYQKPPRAIVDLVDVRPTPTVEVSPGDGVAGRWMLIGNFRVAFDRRFGAARITARRVTFQSQDERAQPRALRDGIEAESIARWRGAPS